jgi:hypothetical protein
MVRQRPSAHDEVQRPRSRQCFAPVAGDVGVPHGPLLRRTFRDRLDGHWMAVDS